jgi:hypothetical protein
MQDRRFSAAPVRAMITGEVIGASIRITPQFPQYLVVLPQENH